MNERVEVISDDKPYMQEAPLQAARVYFTPGKATPVNTSAARSELNWPVDFKVYVGVPAIDNQGGIDHSRVYLTGRNSVCDVTIPAPILTGDVIVMCDDSAGISGTHTVHGTQTQNNNGIQERKTGFDGVIV
jgi:hypothetical protein